MVVVFFTSLTFTVTFMQIPSINGFLLAYSFHFRCFVIFSGFVVVAVVLLKIGMLHFKLLFFLFAVGGLSANFY